MAMVSGEEFELPVLDIDQFDLSDEGTPSQLLVPHQEIKFTNWSALFLQ